MYSGKGVCEREFLKSLIAVRVKSLDLFFTRPLGLFLSNLIKIWKTGQFFF